MKKRAFALALALVMCLGLTVTASAAGAPSYQVLYVSDISGSPSSAYQDYALAYVDQNEGWRLLRYNGSGFEYVTDKIYKSAYEFYPGGYFTSDWNQFYDLQGNLVIPRGEYDYISGIDETYALGQKDVGEGPRALYLIKIADGSAIPFALGINNYGDGLFVGRKEIDGVSHVYYTDISGNTVLTLPEGYSAEPFSDGYASVSVLVNSVHQGYQIIDKTGTVVVDLPARKPGVIISYGGEITEDIVPNEYHIEGKISEGLVLVRVRKFQEHGNEPNHMGYMDMSRNIVVPCEYESNSGEFHHGYAVVEKIDPEDSTKRWVGLVDRNGKVVIPVGEYKKLSDVTETGLIWACNWDGKLCLLKVPVGGNTQTVPPADNIPASNTAYASTQTVNVDGRPVEFQMYALLDENGNGTNYIKLRDLAYVLNGTEAQFAVGYDGTISLTTGQSYAAAGGEMTTPFSGDRAYTGGTQPVKIDGQAVDLTAITLLDDNGGGYNYFKLRDLGRALGFNVSWSAEQGVFIETDEPYAG